MVVIIVLEKDVEKNREEKRRGEKGTEKGGPRIFACVAPRPLSPSTGRSCAAAHKPWYVRRKVVDYLMHIGYRREKMNRGNEGF